MKAEFLICCQSEIDSSSEWSNASVLSLALQSPDWTPWGGARPQCQGRGHWRCGGWAWSERNRPYIPPHSASTRNAEVASQLNRDDLQHIWSIIHQLTVKRYGPHQSPMGGCGKEEWARSQAFVMLSHLSLTSTLKGSFFKFFWIFTNAHKSRPQKSFMASHYATQQGLFSHFLLHFLLCVLEKLPIRFSFPFPWHPAQIPVWVYYLHCCWIYALGRSHLPMTWVNKMMCISIEWQIALKQLCITIPCLRGYISLRQTECRFP